MFQNGSDAKSFTATASAETVERNGRLSTQSTVYLQDSRNGTWGDSLVTTAFASGRGRATAMSIR
jgi:hypothetical protein